MNLFSVLALSIRLYVSALAGNSHDPYWFQLAVNKTASLSTTAAGGDASLAVDVNTQAPCSLTESATSSWFVVDFGRPVFPGLVLVFMNTVVSSSYRPMTMRIGDSQIFSLNGAVAKNTGFSWVRLQRNHQHKGRYLSVHYDPSPTAKPLSICEVYAYWIPIESVSYGKPVAVSLTPGNDLPTHAANDLEWNNVILSQAVEKSWVRIDLLDVYFVREVILVLYPAHNLFDYILTIGSSLKEEGRANPRCNVTDLDKAESKSFRCNLKGRYVLVGLERGGTPQTKVGEIVVNPSHMDNLAETMLVEFPAAEDGFHNKWYITDTNPKSAIVTKDTGGDHWIRIDLGSSYRVAKILLFNVQAAEYKTMMAAFELRVGDSDADNGNSNPLCLPGVHSLVGKITESYFCVPRVTGRYVNIRQADNPVAVAEVGIYSESEPKIERGGNDREIWRKIGATLLFTCKAYGYPAPEVSWQKDNIVLSTTDTLTVKHANESGTYECWANNTHGESMKPVDVSITSELRVCVGSIEVSVELGGNNADVYPKAEQTFLGHKWYRFLDIMSRQYLKMDSKTPNLNICQTKMSGEHPSLSGGVVERNVCVRNETSSCQRKYKVRMRNCGAFYVYNFPSRHEAHRFSYCFRTANKLSGNPSIASMVGANSALSNHVFQTEDGIQDSTDCLLMCSIGKKCKSFNYSRKEKICELNSSTKKENPKDFLSRTGFNYFAKGKGMINRRMNEL